MKKTLQRVKTRHLNRWLILVCLVLSGVVSSVVIGYPKKPAVRPPDIIQDALLPGKKTGRHGWVHRRAALARPLASDGVVRRDRPRTSRGRVPEHREDRPPVGQPEFPKDRRIVFELAKASLFNYEADPARGVRGLAEGAHLAGRGGQTGQSNGSIPSFISRERPRFARARTTTASCAAAKALASCRSPRRPCTRNPMARSWRSSISPSTSPGFPKTSK